PGWVLGRGQGTGSCLVQRSAPLERTLRRTLGELEQVAGARRAQGARMVRIGRRRSAHDGSDRALRGAERAPIGPLRGQPRALPAGADRLWVGRLPSVSA